jgi:hypothetical protein
LGESALLKKDFHSGLILQLRLLTHSARVVRLTFAKRLSAIDRETHALQPRFGQRLAGSFAVAACLLPRQRL